jgi:hypothetical protein
MGNCLRRAWILLWMAPWIALAQDDRDPVAIGPGRQEFSPGLVRVRHAATNASAGPIELRSIAIDAPAGVTVEGAPASLTIPPRGGAELAYTVRLPDGGGVYPLRRRVAVGAMAPREYAPVAIRSYPTLRRLTADARPWTLALSDRVTAAVWSPAGAVPAVLVYIAGAADAGPAAELAPVDNLLVDHPDGSRGPLALAPDSTATPREPRFPYHLAGTAGDAGRWHWSIEREGGGLRARATFTASAATSIRRFEGMVLRVPGRGHAGAFFSGLEYLGRDEPSSSTADLETPEHVRVAPNPLKVTLPLMGVARGGAAVGLAWPLGPGCESAAPLLQPSFSVPNSVDGGPDHRLSLSLPAVGQGRRENAWEADRPIDLKAEDILQLEATLYVLPGAGVEGLIEAWLKDHPLPSLPQAPRGDAASLDLARRSFLESRLWDPAKKGWSHCAEPTWARQPYADHAGYLWKLGLLRGDEGRPEADRVREVLAAHPKLAGNGAHLRTRMISFTLGPVMDSLAEAKRQAEIYIAQQRPDGLWTYEGKYRRGHFEDTASGFCAPRAFALLEYAQLSLDPRARDAGLRALAAMRRFQVPRGAQTWELSLHTPDILAAAHLVGAYVRGYELTNDPAHLAEARRWALAGLPFVYLWDRADLPTMRYATIAVFGATNWRSPNWIGLPVQWCGTVYAYRLLDLARHDRTIDWRRVAEGITVAAERMQHAAGPHAGTLPDFFHIAAQRRDGPSINPGAIVALRLALAGDRPDAETDLATWKERPIAVTTVAREVRIATGADGRCVLRGRFHAGAPYHWVVAGCPDLAEVTVNGAAALRPDVWPAPGSVWRQADGLVLVRIAASNGADEIRFR